MPTFIEQFEKTMDAHLASVESLANGTYAPEGVDTSDEDFNAAQHWLENEILDIEFVVGRDLGYKSANLLVAFGGPNVWVDLEEAQIDGYWGGDHLVRHISYAARDKLTDEAECWYNTLRGNS